MLYKLAKCAPYSSNFTVDFGVIQAKYSKINKYMDVGARIVQNWFNTKRLRERSEMPITNIMHLFYSY